MKKTSNVKTKKKITMMNPIPLSLKKDNLKYSKMELNIRDNGSGVKDRVLEYKSGQTEHVMRAIGNRI